MDQNNQTGISSSVYAPKLGVSQIAPISPTAPITVSSIKPATPAVVPQTQPSTIADSINGTADAALTQQKALETKVQSEADAAKKAAESSQSDLSKTFQDIINVQSGRAQAETDAGLPALNTQLADIAGEIEKARQAQQKEIDAVTANGSISKEGQAGLISNINTKYARSNVDLLITQDILQRKYDSAQKNVDRKIELALEPLKTKLDFQKQYYQDNKERWNDAKQKEYQNLVTQSQREYEKQKETQTNIGKVLLEAGQNGADQATLANIGKATDLAGAIAAAGPYAVDIKKKLEVEKLQKEIAALGGGTLVSTPQVQAYAGVLSTILGSGKFTKDQKQSLISSINSGDDPFSVVKNQAKNIMGQTEATKLTSYEVARDTFTDIGNDLAQFYKDGGKTSLVSGTLEQVAQKLGQVNDPKLRELATKISGEIAIYRNAISGTAYSNQEGKQIDAIFPGINNSQELNNAIISGRQRLFDSIIDATYRTALGKSYDDLKAANLSEADKKKVETDADTKLNSYILAHPDKSAEITNALNNAEAALGRPLTSSEFLQAHPEYK